MIDTKKLGSYLVNILELCGGNMKKFFNSLIYTDYALLLWVLTTSAFIYNVDWVLGLVYLINSLYFGGLLYNFYVLKLKYLKALVPIALFFVIFGIGASIFYFVKALG
jgi:hypothetical protein